MGESARTPGAPSWPDKLITQAEAFAKAAEWPVYAGVSAGSLTQQGERAMWIRADLFCGQCNRSCGQLLVNNTTYNGSLDQILAMVLRHMVMAHDVPLNTRPPSSDDGPGRVPGPAVSEEQLATSWLARHG